MLTSNIISCLEVTDRLKGYTCMHECCGRSALLLQNDGVMIVLAPLM